jgi:hypothetical protein
MRIGKGYLAETTMSANNVIPAAAIAAAAIADARSRSRTCSAIRRASVTPAEPGESDAGEDPLAILNAGGATSRSGPKGINSVKDHPEPPSRISRIRCQRSAGYVSNLR